MFLINFWLVLVFLVVFWSLKQAKDEGEFCATLGNKLPSQSKDARKRIRERNLTWRKSRGEHLQDTFRALFRVHFIHTIYRFEAWEVRSPMLQIVCKSELKWRSYSHLKATAPSWKWISHHSFSLAQFLQPPFSDAKILASPFPHAKFSQHHTSHAKCNIKIFYTDSVRFLP